MSFFLPIIIFFLAFAAGFLSYFLLRKIAVKILDKIGQDFENI